MFGFGCSPASCETSIEARLVEIRRPLGGEKSRYIARRNEGSFGGPRFYYREGLWGWGSRLFPPRLQGGSEGEENWSRAFPRRDWNAVANQKIHSIAFVKVFPLSFMRDREKGQRKGKNERRWWTRVGGSGVWAVIHGMAPAEPSVWARGRRTGESNRVWGCVPEGVAAGPGDGTARLGSPPRIGWEIAQATGVLNTIALASLGEAAD